MTNNDTSPEAGTSLQQNQVTKQKGEKVDSL
jgi:hypothetical protein